MTKRKVGVIGGTGNISAAFVPALLAAGHEVTCINRGQHGPVLAGTKHLRCDRSKQEAFEKDVQGAVFDTVIDMLAFTAEDVYSTMRACVDVEHLIHCSTVCAYGTTLHEYPTLETHVLQPSSTYGRGKAAADNALLEAHRERDVPVTIVRPSTTYGPQMGMPRQLGGEFSWLDRVRAGKPVVVVDGGQVKHQYLHVDDAASFFVGVVARPQLAGEVINMVCEEYVTWADYHRSAMVVLGTEVELVSVTLAQARAANSPGFGLCEEIFRHESWFSGAKARQLVPEFMPKITLEEGMRSVVATMNADGRLPVVEPGDWEDRLIATVRG